MKKSFQGFSFALGLVFGLIVVGCMVAASNPGNANTGWRYEFVPNADISFTFVPSASGGELGIYHSMAVFDRETGTVNVHSRNGDLTAVLPFQAN